MAKHTFPRRILCRTNVTNFELYLDFSKSIDKLHEMEEEIKEYAILTQDDYGSRIDFVI